MCSGTGAGTGQGSGSGSGSGAQDGATSNALAIVSEVSKDIARAQNIPRLVTAGVRVASHVMTFYSTNAPSGVIPQKTLDFMGTARIFLSPLNLGYETFKALGLGTIAVDWIRIKVLGITLSSAAYNKLTIETTESTSLPPLRTTSSSFRLRGQRTPSATFRRRTSLLGE